MMESKSIKIVDIALNPNESVNIFINGVKRYSCNYGNIKNKKMEIMSEFVTEICNRLGVNYYDIMNKKKHRDLSIIRHALFYYLTEKYNFTSVSIAKFFNRDHSTVLYGNKNFISLLSVKDPESITINEVILNYFKEITVQKIA